MIKLTDKDKTLTIPSGLGNFGQGSGSGGGISPEEAAEIASAVTAEALDEYDTELQVDLEEIRDAVSGNSEDIAELSGVTSGLSGDLNALAYASETMSRALSAATENVATLSGATQELSAATQAIEQGLGDYATTADTQAIQESLGNYATTADTAAIQESLGDYATTAETQAIMDGLADYATTADTAAIQQSLVDYATTATTDGLSTGITALSAVTSGLAVDIETLSGSSKVFILDAAAIYSAATNADRTALWEEAEAKYLAGYKVYLKGKSGDYDVTLPLVKYQPYTGNIYSGQLDFVVKNGSPNEFWDINFYHSGAIPAKIGNGGSLATSNIYTLPKASSSALGGIKVGSGLSIDSNSKLSVKAGEGLGFSGDTLVVSGISAGGTSYFLNNMTQAERADLASLLLDYWQEGNDNDFSSYPIDTMSIYWYLPDSGGAYDDEGYKDYVLLVPSRASLDTEWEQGAVWLMGSYAAPNDSDNCVRGFRVILLEDGSFAGVQPFAIDIPTIPDLVYVRFGNDEKGGLTYDADNGYFIYDSANVATGDTSSYQQDVIDYIFTKAVIDGSKVFGYLCPVGTFKFFVTSGGTTYTYSNPTVKYSELASPVTIDDVEFSEEVTFRYSDWELTAWFAGDNRGANLRIKAL